MDRSCGLWTACALFLLGCGTPVVSSAQSSALDGLSGGYLATYSAQTTGNASTYGQSWQTQDFYTSTPKGKTVHITTCGSYWGNTDLRIYKWNASSGYGQLSSEVSGSPAPSGHTTACSDFSYAVTDQADAVYWRVAAGCAGDEACGAGIWMESWETGFNGAFSQYSGSPLTRNTNDAQAVYRETTIGDLAAGTTLTVSSDPAYGGSTASINDYPAIRLGYYSGTTWNEVAHAWGAFPANNNATLSFTSPVPRRYHLRIGCVSSWGCTGAIATTTAGELLGYTSLPPFHAGKDYNNCVNDVPSAFNRLRTRPEMLTLELLESTPQWYPDTDGGDARYHIQSVNRMPLYKDDSTGVSRDLSKYIVLNQAMDPSTGPGQVGYGYMGKQSPVQPGERLRAGRMDPWVPDWSANLQPNVLRNPLFTPPSSYNGYVLNHPSGSAPLGSYMVTAWQNYYYVVTLLGYFDHSWATAAIYDLSVLPDDGGPVVSPIPVAAQFPLASKGFNWVSAAKLSDGSYLLIARTSDDYLEIYRNQSGALTAANGFTNSNSGGNAANATAIAHIPGYVAPANTRTIFQTDHTPGGDNGHLITECGTGKLYLMVSDGDNPSALSLYRIRLIPENNVGYATLNSDGKGIYSLVRPDLVTLQDFSPTDWVAHVNVNCTPRDDHSGVSCNFAKAGGAYVDPNNRLLYYGGNAAFNFDSNSSAYYTDLAEFRSSDPNQVDSSAGKCDLNHAFFELYDQKIGDGSNGAQSSTGGPYALSWPQSLIVDYPDRNKRSKNYAAAYSFDNLAQSVRYCIPAGVKYVMHEMPTPSWGTGWTLSFCGDGAAGCTGNVSNGVTQGYNFSGSNPSSQSGCFMSSGSDPTIFANCL